MTYLGYDVLEIEPSDDGGRQIEYSRSRFRLDSNTGARADLDRSGLAVLRPSGFIWVMDGRAEIQGYRDWLADRLGALVPFWVPSWKHDLLLAEDVPSGTAYSIEGSGYTVHQFPFFSRRHLAFLLGDGSKYYREVTSSEVDGDVENIVIDSGIPVAVKVKETMVSLLMLCRLAVDDPELVWESRDVAQANLEFVELPREVEDMQEGS